MKVCYNESMVLPRNCVTMDEEEMCYVEGGETILYNPLYATKGGALLKAGSYISQMKWKNIKCVELAMEIYFHAMAFYNGAAFLNACSLLGYSVSGIKNSGFWKSLADGINVENGVDTRILYGKVKRYNAYAAFYAL